MKRKSQPTGARESNAGDDFHVLWAARRAVHLLNPQSDLRRVFVEKLSAVDEALSDSDEDLFLGVDISEYFGGDTFASATHIDVSQLKYSTRHPEQTWTASRLTQTNRSVSVIRRLAAVYQGYAQNHSRDEVVRKLRIRLISNQPAAADLQAALFAAQKILIEKPLKGVALIRELQPEHQSVIQTLSNNVPFSKADFSDFLRVFDLSGCGEASRQRQRLELIKELAPQVSNDPVATLRPLCDLIRSEAMPERASSNGLTEHDVLAALEVSNRENLFPAPAEFQSIARLIETRDAPELAQTIINTGGGGKIIAHGTAGLGKTTTVQELHRHLPLDSVVLTYDCFGGGGYKIPGGQRHTQSRAFRQLTNELAVHCGTPFLLRPAHEVADLQRDFRRSLEMAARVVAVKQDALLVIVIDAADNAFIAADSERDCFVPDLLQIPLPENCRLVMTCRSHRRIMLQAPPETIEYRLEGFDEAASATHLMTIYADANDSDCAEFHRRTGGNPRMQAYLLSRAALDSTSLIPLEQLFAGKRETLENLFRDLLESATTHSPQQAKSNDLLAGLMCLTRPVQPGILAEVHGLKSEDALNFCHALEPGVRLEEGAVWFRDEDFETFLRDQLTPEAVKAAHERLGLWFLQAPNASAYAARFVAEHLVQAGRHTELIKLAINGPAPEAVKDEIIHLQVLRKRLSLAMQSACATNDGVNAVRLVMLAAEAARSNGAVAALVRANPELAVLCGSTNSARRLYLREREYGWPGAAHLRLAAIFARTESERERARDHFEMGHAWIRRKFSLPKTETRQWNIHLDDIAHGAEAIFWLDGTEKAVQWLNTWQPKDVVLMAATHLVRSLANKLPLAELERLIVSLGLSALANAVLLTTLWRRGHKPSFEFADRTAKRIERFLRVGRKLPELSNHYSKTNAWAVSFCESLAATGISPDRVISIMRTLGPSEVHSAPYHAIEALQHELPLRGACLIAALEGKELTVKQLMPEALRKKDEKNNYDSRHENDRRQFELTTEILLSAFQARAQTIIGNPPLAEMEQRIAADLRRHSFKTDYPVRLQFLFQPWALRVCETLLRCMGSANDLLERIADSAEENIHDGAPGFWTEMAEQLIRQEQYQALAYRLLDRAANYVMEHPFPARDRWQQLLNCAAAVSQFDEDLCRDYYKRALAAADGIDDDLIPMLKLFCRMTNYLPEESSREERQNFAARIAGLVETHKNYVSEESHQLWRETLETATRLSPADGFAMCSRWDDEGFCEVDDGILPTVKEAARRGFLTPLESLALLRLAGEEHDISADVVPLLEHLHRAGPAARPQLSLATAKVSEWIRRDVPLSARQRSAQCILDWCEANRLMGLSGLTELREMLAFVNTLRPDKDNSDSTPFQWEQEREEQSRTLVESAKDANLDSFVERLRALRQSSYGGKPVTDFVTTFGKALRPAQRIEYLEQIVAAASDTLLANDLIESLRGLLAEWCNHLGVREWIPRGIQRLLENGLPGLIRYEYETADYLRAALSLPGLSDQSRMQLLLPAIAKHLNQLSPRGLYVITEVLVELLPAEDARKLLTWALDKTEKHFNRHNRPLPALAAPAQIETSSAALAHFLWSMFGHPDKQVRWRALHAARFIIKQPNEAVLRELMNLSRTETVGAFRSANPKMEFYWMSARSWLMVLLLRLADEQPILLREHLEAIAVHALDRTFPHAQIREMARRTVLRLIKNFPGILPSQVAENIRLINQPSACSYPRESIYKLEGRGQEGQDWEEVSERFSFDYIDAVRYWFAPLSRVFGYPKPSVTGRAKRWVCDCWGRTDLDRKNDPRRLRYEHQWELTAGGQGSIPTIEILQKYLEHHSLHCVAGEMLDEGLPVAVDDYDEPEYLPECPWEDWIKDEVSASNECWLSDLRSPTPFLPECWGSWPGIGEWLTQRSPEAYDAGLGLLEPEHQGEFVIAGYINLWDADRHGDVHVSSALVTTEKAQALLRALQTMTNPHDFNLNLEIDEPGFELKNFYDDQRVEDGLDEFDPLCRNASASHWMPIQDFIRAMRLQPVHGKPKYTLPTGEIAVKLEIWSDQSIRNRQRIQQFFSEGQRLWVRIESLLEYLNQCARDLILEVKIARRRDTNSRKEEEKYDFGRSTLYLLRRDGKLETLFGSRDIRDADRKRTRLGG